MIRDALCLVRVESNWEENKECELPMSEGQEEEGEEENIPQSKQGKSFLPAAYASLFSHSFSLFFTKGIRK